MGTGWVVGGDGGGGVLEPAREPASSDALGERKRKIYVLAIVAFLAAPAKTTWSI